MCVCRRDTKTSGGREEQCTRGVLQSPGRASQAAELSWDRTHRLVALWRSAEVWGEEEEGRVRRCERELGGMERLADKILSYPQTKVPVKMIEMRR